MTDDRSSTGPTSSGDPTPSRPGVHVVPATSAEDLDDARRLFRAYVESLDFDLDFQGVEDELAGLPGPYAAPGGALLLARHPDTGQAVGCVAVRPLGDGGTACEMKRLYVMPAWRGAGVGQRLAEAVLDAARRLGYDVMRLDTVRAMHAARALYARLGFHEIEAYYPNPLPDVVYLERRLNDAG